MDKTNQSLETKEPTARITIDLPEDWYVSLKVKVRRDRTTMKQYLTDLLKKELKDAEND